MTGRATQGSISSPGRASTRAQLCAGRCGVRRARDRIGFRHRIGAGAARGRTGDAERGFQRADARFGPYLQLSDVHLFGAQRLDLFAHFRVVRRGWALRVDSAADGKRKRRCDEMLQYRFMSYPRQMCNMEILLQRIHFHFTLCLTPEHRNGPNRTVPTPHSASGRCPDRTDICLMRNGVEWVAFLILFQKRLRMPSACRHRFAANGRSDPAQKRVYQNTTTRSS